MDRGWEVVTQPWTRKKSISDCFLYGQKVRLQHISNPKLTVGSQFLEAVGQTKQVGK